MAAFTGFAGARAADAPPPGAARLSLYRAIVMASFLPDQEGARLRLEFEQELARLKAA